MTTTAGRFFLCSYWPLCKTLGGRRAVAAYGLPPFVNGMSRREPDFEHARPAITSSSRGRGFVPRLHVGDTVVYTTTKGRWDGGPPHWRLVAVLEVAERYETHGDAAAGYAARGLAPPGNLVVPGNAPLPAPLTVHHGSPHDGGWDDVCRERAAEVGVVLACIPRFVDVFSPPAVTEAL
ncbi:MAG TPA: hypothetical protein VF576_12550, partial [Rubricoccaceae bacterium]